MSSAAPAAALDLEVLPDRPPIVTVDPGPDAPGWVTAHRDALRAAVTEHGAVLVRGLQLPDAASAGAAFTQLGDLLTSEREAFAPRTALAPGVFSATAWPARQPMCLHHELSYRLDVPALMLLACLTPPTSGGVTPIADAAAVLADLPTDLVDRFARNGWQLLRCYTDEIGASWPAAFGTDDRAQVERYCAAQAIEVEWLPGGGLRTRQRRPAVLTHPVTGHRCWFNQVAFLSEWTMEPEVREFLVEEYGADGLPFATRFGDGAEIGSDVVDLVNSSYERCSRREPWQAGDLLVLDNLATAHGREPYTGERAVVVGLADPVRPLGVTR